MYSYFKQKIAGCVHLYDSVLDALDAVLKAISYKCSSVKLLHEIKLCRSNAGKKSQQRIENSFFALLFLFQSI